LVLQQVMLRQSKHLCFDVLTAKKNTDVSGAIVPLLPPDYNQRPRRRPCPVVLKDCVTGQIKRRRKKWWNSRFS